MERTGQFVGAADVEHDEGWPSAFAPPDGADLWLKLATPDGDGGMLGVVLIYAAILVVPIATILWKILI